MKFWSMMIYEGEIYVSNVLNGAYGDISEDSYKILKSFAEKENVKEFYIEPK